MDSQTLRLRIYYSQSGWHLLLKDCLKPCIDRNTTAGLIEAWYFQFSKNTGDNILIEIKLFTRQLKKEILSEVDQFLIKNKSTSQKIDFPIKKLFTDFPNNSICLNQANMMLEYVPRDNEFIIRQLISESIIEGLALDIIDIESIFAFVLYVHFGILKAILTESNEAYVIFQSLIRSDEESMSNVKLERSILTQGEEVYVKIIEQNACIIRDIFNDVWIDNYCEEEFKWLEKWVCNCKKMLKIFDPASLFDRVSTHIFAQLGLSNITIVQLRKIILTTLSENLN